MYPIATFSANGTSAAYIIPYGAGGPQTLVAEGTFGSGTLTFQIRVAGTSWIPLEVGNTAISWTAASAVAIFYIAPGTQIRAILSGATSPTITINLGAGQ